MARKRSSNIKEEIRRRERGDQEMEKERVEDRYEPKCRNQRRKGSELWHILSNTLTR